MNKQRVFVRRRKNVRARYLRSRERTPGRRSAEQCISRAYSMRLVARDACGALLSAYLTKITCALLVRDV